MLRFSYLIRKKVLEDAGFRAINVRTKINKSGATKSIIISLFHLCKLFLFNKKYDTVFFSFPRVDKINGIYIDKFTDPLIETEAFQNNYIILEHGLGGVHSTPRMHSKHIVYLDLLKILSQTYARLTYKRFCRKYTEELSLFFEKIDLAFGDKWDRNFIIKEIIAQYATTRFLYLIFRRIQAKRVIGPARDYLTKAFIPAKKLNMETYELQHGITYAETEMYSGYREKMILPDYFLAFGNNKPSDVYGIDENRIVNIGWALSCFISNLPQAKQFGPNDVLVISGPKITDAIIHTVLLLAKEHPKISFYIRPHPHEIISESQMNLLEAANNIKIQDKRMNISVVLQGFDNVIGENSTVLYEALAIGKKVGKLFFEGLNPKYLEESDRDCFWEIKCPQDFDAFIAGDNTTKRSKCIYSKFNKDLFLKTIGLK